MYIERGILCLIDFFSNVLLKIIILIEIILFSSTQRKYPKTCVEKKHDMWVMLLTFQRVAWIWIAHIERTLLLKVFPAMRTYFYCSIFSIPEIPLDNPCVSMLKSTGTLSLGLSLLWVWVPLRPHIRQARAFVFCRWAGLKLFTTGTLVYP